MFSRILLTSAPEEEVQKDREHDAHDDHQPYRRVEGEVAAADEDVAGEAVNAKSGKAEEDRAEHGEHDRRAKENLRSGLDGRRVALVSRRSVRPLMEETPGERRLVGRNANQEETMLHSPQIRQELGRQRETDLLRQAEKERLALLAAGNPENLQSRARALRARLSSFGHARSTRSQPAPNPA
jgi:hypothetical protein